VSTKNPADDGGVEQNDYKVFDDTLMPSDLAEVLRENETLIHEVDESRWGVVVFTDKVSGRLHTDLLEAGYDDLRVTPIVSTRDENTGLDSNQFGARVFARLYITLE